MKKAKTLSVALLLLLLSTIEIYAQEYTFPQNVSYAYGYSSSYLTGTHAEEEYENFMDYYIECDDSEARIVNASGYTVSEGIGYGMLLTAYMGDEDKFSKLWSYYESRENSNGVMNWQYLGCSTSASGTNGATDGDLDAAFALLIAIHQWPEKTSWISDLEYLLECIEEYEFTTCSGLIVQKPGDSWGGCTCTNPSYYSPGYYRAFASFLTEQGDESSASFWNQAADDCYETLLANMHPNTGLVYAWTNKDGGTYSGCSPSVSGGGGAEAYQYDACRTPWRIAMDYVWYGTEDAKTFLTTIADFINTPATDQGDWYGLGGITNTVDGYYHNGEAYGEYFNAPFVGSFALTGMASSQDDADTFLRVARGVTGDNYFNTCVAALYKFLASGNFWNPYSIKPCSSPDLGDNKTLCGNSPLQLDAGVEIDNIKTYTWYKDGDEYVAASTDARAINITEAGEYEVTVDSAGECSNSDKVTVTATLPSIDLGDDFELCSPASVTVSSGVEGGDLTYLWQRDGVTIPTAIGPDYEITSGGTYSVEVGASGCTSVSDEVTVTSNLLTVTNNFSTIESGSSVTLTVTDGGGPYNWYASADSETILATGDSYTVSPASSTMYYVQDEGTISITAGPDASSNDLSTYQNSGYVGISFTADMAFEITGVTIQPYVYSCNSGDVVSVTFALSDGTSTIGTYSSSEISCSGTGSDTQFTLTFDPSISVPSSGSYTLTPTEGGNQLVWYESGADFSDFSYSGVVTFTGDTRTDMSNSFPGVFDFIIQTGSGCERTPVTVYIDGDCGDYDGDGVDNCTDECPLDSDKTEPGECGCGVQEGTCYLAVENIEEAGISVYPNPVTEVLVLAPETDLQAAYFIRTIDGRVVLTGDISGETNVDVSELEQGIYILTLEGEVNYNYRIIKQ